MNIKTFTIIAIASFAVLSVTACGGKQKASIETEQTEETSKTEVIVSDNKLLLTLICITCRKKSDIQCARQTRS